MPSAALSSTFEDHLCHHRPARMGHDVPCRFNHLASFDSYSQGKLGTITDGVQEIAKKVLLREELSSKLQLIQDMADENFWHTQEAALSRQEVQQISEKTQARPRRSSSACQLRPVSRIASSNEERAGRDTTRI
ncbi:hypothetical protein IAU59_007605 [Kwoniella sp. CBS 9459]